MFQNYSMLCAVCLLNTPLRCFVLYVNMYSTQCRGCWCCSLFLMSFLLLWLPVLPLLDICLMYAFLFWTGSSGMDSISESDGMKTQRSKICREQNNAPFIYCFFMLLLLSHLISSAPSHKTISDTRHLCKSAIYDWFQMVFGHFRSDRFKISIFIMQ